MIVVDSSVWIDFLRGTRTPEVERLLRLLGRQPLLVGEVILLEVLQGIADDAEAARVDAAMRQFAIEPMLDDSLAVAAAAHYRRLRALGITVRKTIDLIIATFCIARGHALLTSDRDFRPMAMHLGLRLA